VKITTNDLWLTVMACTNLQTVDNLGKNMGLKNSEHIAQIIVDPKDANIIYVAAYGPVWSEGGDRGVYKSTDGGATWTCVKKCQRLHRLQ
jgi:hypothetical protein